MAETLYDRVGGREAFDRLIEAFYRRVETDEVLRPMYPDDLGPGKRHLAMFFAQYWGGGPIYNSERGHPRLRMRHAEFPITHDAALRWAHHMADAITEQGFDEDVERALLEYVVRATPTLINRLDADDDLPRSG